MTARLLAKKKDASWQKHEIIRATHSFDGISLPRVNTVFSLSLTFQRLSQRCAVYQCTPIQNVDESISLTLVASTKP